MEAAIDEKPDGYREESPGDNSILMIAPKRRIDFFLMFTVIGLAFFGVIMIFSASYYVTLRTDNDPFEFLRSAAFWAGGGLILMVVFAYIPFRIWQVLAVPFLIFSFALLVLLFPFGDTLNGATRWIRVGPITIMPGEIAKFGCIAFTAWFYTKYRKRTENFILGFMPPVLVMGLCFVLIFKQPNLSTALILCGIIAGMMFIAGVKKRYLLMSMFAGLAVVALLIYSNPAGEHYRRFQSYLDPFADTQGDSYQIVQSLLALGAGGLAGTGPGGSVQKAFYLPYAQNDFIFAIIGEELGFLGCLVIMIAYLILIWRCTLVALGAPDRFSMLLASGITIMLALQVIINIAVVTASIPATGVILPFISYGGNATVLFMIAMGIMLNISRASPRPAVVKLPEKRRKKEEVQYDIRTSEVQ